MAGRRVCLAGVSRKMLAEHWFSSSLRFLTEMLSVDSQGNPISCGLSGGRAPGHLNHAGVEVGENGRQWGDSVMTES